MRSKVLKLNYSKDAISAFLTCEKSIGMVVGNKNGILVTEDGVSVNLTSPSRFTVSSGGVSHCGFYQETPFPLCFLAGPVSMPSQIPQIPFGLENIATMAEIGACTSALASSFAAV